MDIYQILADVLCGNEEIVILAHLSQDNNLPDLAYNTVRECIISQGIDTSHDVNLSLSHRDRASNIYIID